MDCFFSPLCSEHLVDMESIPQSAALTMISEMHSQERAAQASVGQLNGSNDLHVTISRPELPSSIGTTIFGLLFILDGVSDIL